MSEKNCSQHSGHDTLLKSILDDIVEIKDNHKKDHDLLLSLEQSTKSSHHRIDEIVEQNRIVRRVSNSVELLIYKMNDLLPLVKDLGDRVEDVEDAPGKEALNYKNATVLALVAGIIGYLVNYLPKLLGGLK